MLKYVKKLKTLWPGYVYIVFVCEVEDFLFYVCGGDFHVAKIRVLEYDKDYVFMGSFNILIRFLMLLSFEM